MDSTGAVLNGTSVTWTSSAPAVATISAGGELHALSVGSTSIIASVEGGADTAHIFVLIPVAQIILTPARDTVPPGTAVPLTAQALDSAGNIVARNILWSSLDSNMATVDSHGVVTVHYPGTAIILARVENRTASARLSSFANYSQISAGEASTCAVATTGKAFCWGGGLFLRLGTDRRCLPSCNQPVNVVAPGIVFSTVSTLAYHACGLAADLAVHCWGNGAYGRLGRIPMVGSGLAAPVDGGVSFASISVAFNHSCGIATAASGGDTWCWGLGDAGQLGIPTPLPCHPSGLGSPCVAVPTALGRQFTTISAGPSASCGVDPAGAAWCWGRNHKGELGAGPGVGTTCYAVPGALCSQTPVPVAGGHVFQSIAMGLFHGCGLTISSAVYCWGWNLHGQVGNDTTTTSFVPVLVSTLPPVATLTSGEEHTCALTSGGDAYCWGRNFSGQLGGFCPGGSLWWCPGPILVTGSKFTVIEAGTDHTCGIAVDGYAYCWGSNAMGQLGNRTLTSSMIPVRVFGQAD